MFLSLRHTNQLRPGPSGIFFLSTIFPCRGRRTKMCLDRCFRLIFIPDQANCSRNVSGKRILRYYFFLTCSPPPQKCRDQEPRSPTPSTGRPPLTTAAAKTEMRGSRLWRHSIHFVRDVCPLRSERKKRVIS